MGHSAVISCSYVFFQLIAHWPLATTASADRLAAPRAKHIRATTALCVFLSQHATHLLNSLSLFVSGSPSLSRFSSPNSIAQNINDQCPRCAPKRPTHLCVSSVQRIANGTKHSRHFGIRRTVTLAHNNSSSIVEYGSEQSTASDTDSPPSAKRRRMQVETQTAGTVRSVDAARRDGLKEAKHAAMLKSPQRGAHHEVEQTRTVPKLTDTQHNVIRIIGQYLSDLGLRDTVDVLVQETGCRLEHPLASRLRDCIVRGLWNKALDTVSKMSEVASERQCTMVRVLLLEEKFRELLRINQPVMAIRLLQNDYPKWDTLRKRRDKFAQMVMAHSGIKEYQPLDPEQQKAHNKNLLARIHMILPLNLMLPPNRLEQLLSQAHKHQVSSCQLHLIKAKGEVRPPSILRNHRCTFGHFPGRTSQIVTDHADEVWCLQFSHCGQYLASGTKNGQVAIWKVDPKTRTISKYKQMSMGMVSASTLSWSTDGKYVATTGTEDNHTGIVVFDVHLGSVESIVRCERGETFSTVSFGKGHPYSVACADQKGHFYYCDIKRPNLPTTSFEGYRIRSLHCMKDGKTILAADTHNRIRSYRIDTSEEATVIQEFKTIICFTLDKSETFCLVTAKAEGLRLWNLTTRQFIRSFFGSVHGEYVIFATFGGDDEHFIATGSEDNKIVIWNRQREQPVRYLCGHTGTVNAVSWNPRYHDMLASSSDDGTIRIWTPELRK
uniref:LisH domain-containing protein n=1 Tax=Steinernema glaseri TaxID=37863 RepID=A0A1I7ZIS5_9BILA